MTTSSHKYFFGIYLPIFRVLIDYWTFIFEECFFFVVEKIEKKITGYLKLFCHLHLKEFLKHGPQQQHTKQQPYKKSDLTILVFIKLFFAI